MSGLFAKKMRNQSQKWTTYDEILQYRCLVKLHLRDRKVAKSDAIVKEKQLEHAARELQEDIAKSRADLDNAVRGDRHQLRNVLREYREMQLTCGNNLPKDVLERLNQDIFRKRKCLDRIVSKVKQRNQSFFEAELELVQYKDKVERGNGIKTSLELRTEAVTGKLQEATLKREAALTVRSTYKEILELLKKESQHYNYILQSLQVDSNNQSNCLMEATILGQLATEYLDDRTQEFDLLSVAIKRDKKARKSYINVVQSHSKNIGDRIQQLVRPDIYPHLEAVETPLTRCEKQLKGEIKNMEELFCRFQKMVHLTSHDDIVACVEQQGYNEVYLSDIICKAAAQRNILLQLQDHAKDILVSFKNQTEASESYETAEAEVKRKLEEADDKRKRVRKSLGRHEELLVGVNGSLQRILELCDLVAPEPKRIKKVGSYAIVISQRRRKKPERLEVDGKRIINQLHPMLEYLIQNEPDRYEYEDALYMQRPYQNADTINRDFQGHGLVTDQPSKETGVATRTDIRAQSNRIVEGETYDDDLVPVYITRRELKRMKSR